MQLSIILPCYNAASLLERSLGSLSRYLDERGCEAEVLIVNDGSDDESAALLDTAASPRLRVIHLPQNRGKGYAVRIGMREARGAVRVFTDIDLPYSLDNLSAVIAAVEAGHPAVFGNRLLPASQHAARVSLLRRAGSAAFGLFAAQVVGSRGKVDTQCGLKGFSGPLAEALFPLLRQDRFGFDVEIFMLLNRAGVPLELVPVTLVNQDISTVNLGTGLRTFQEIGALWLQRQQDYDLSALLPFGKVASDQ